MKSTNRLVAWGIQDLFLKIESLEVLEVPFKVEKVVPEELLPLSQFIIEFDVVELPEDANKAPVSFID